MLNYNYWSNPAIAALLIGVLSLISNLYLYSRYGDTQETYLYGLITLFISYFILRISKIESRKNSGILYFSFSKPIAIVKIYYYFSFFGLLLALIIIYSRGISQSESIFFSLRYAHTIDQLPTYGLQYFSLFSLVLSVYFLVEKKNRKSIIFFIIPIIISLTFAERSSILYTVTVYLYFYTLLNKVNKLILIIAFFVLLTLFQIIALSAGKAIGSDGENYVLSYFSYPLVAFEEKLLGYTINPSYRSVFGILATPLDSIFSHDHFNSFDESGFNVYTYMYPTFFLFGKTGFFLIMSALGFFLFFIEMLSSRIFVLHFLRASILFSSVMIFYAWTFSITNHIYIIMIALPLFYRVKIK